MILVFEMLWVGTQHAPGNSATIQAIARGFPDQAVRVFADPSHLAELRTDPGLTACANVGFAPIAIHPAYRGKTHLVAWGRFRQEFATLRHGLKQVPRGARCLLMLISATPTAIFAASLLARMNSGRIGVQVGLHGNLNDAFGWRPRNPLTRAFDLRRALTAHHPKRLRFMVLEQGIRDTLATLLPRAAARTDVLELPINVAELADQPAPGFAPPIRIGLVGLATAAKGTHLFLDLAREMTARFPGKVTFHHVGRLTPDADPAPFAVLADPPSTAHLSRAEFTARLAALHYVFLPIREGYYNLSASGALLDAMTWAKPVITRALPIITPHFQRFGDIGYLCDSDAAMRTAVETILIDMDADRYARQVAAMQGLRAARTPAALAGTYRAMIERQYPGVLTPIT
ncbi:MAG TPA: hypothetical protein VFE41_09420 [Acetobacteraceae bacterium]|jgi:hypothetical protein|nr:hypothetical protein [Acetobacteraceae bacterium]